MFRLLSFLFVFPLLVVDLGFSWSNLIVQTQQLLSDVSWRVISAVRLHHLVSLLFSLETESGLSDQVWQVGLSISLPLLAEVHHGVDSRAGTVRVQFFYPGQTSSFSSSAGQQVSAGAKTEAATELSGGFLPSRGGGG